MPSADVTAFYRQIEALGITVWLDGGWGVDALLGRQTRTHADLDVVVQEKDLRLLFEFLQDRGFRELPRDDSRAWNFVMGDGRGREIDLHVIAIDREGNGIYGPPERKEGMYPAAALQGQGQIEDLSVRCVSPEFQIRSHAAYEPDETDYEDVRALAERFGLGIPQSYEKCPRPGKPSLAERARRHGGSAAWSHGRRQRRADQGGPRSGLRQRMALDAGVVVELPSGAWAFRTGGDGRLEC
jgi:lincosamide nucleotidyltransferase A/C/D/E